MLDLQHRYPKRSEICLRLYSLLLVAPELDNRRTPCDFLVQGLCQTGGGGPCHELYRREIEDNPDEALTERFAELLHTTTQIGLLSTFVKWRWSTAGRLKRFNVIGDDLPGLRRDSPLTRMRFGCGCWHSRRINSPGHAPQPSLSVCRSVCKKLPCTNTCNCACSAVFDRLDDLERIASGWQSLMKKRDVPADLLELLSQYWTRMFAEIRRGVTTLLAAIDADTNVWLTYLDRVNEASPPLLFLFGQMLDAYEQTLVLEADDRDPAELTVLARQFLEERGGLRYTAALRPRLLAFCLREWIDPDVIAQLAVNRTVVLPKARLNKLVNDRPLRHVYRACTLFRN